MEKKLKEFKVYVTPNYNEKVYEVKAVDELEAELEAIKLHDRGRWEGCDVEEKEQMMGVLKNREIEKMENERLKERTQEPTMADDEMRMLARKFLVAVCDSRLEYQDFKIVDEVFGKFSEEDWETFKKFVQYAL